MPEPAQPEIIRPQKIKEGLSFRLPGEKTQDYLSGFSLTGQVKKFLVDWEAFRNGMNDWNFWRPPPVMILVDDGLGGKGSCRACGSPHVQIYPVNGRPAVCHEAFLLQQSEKK